MLLTDSLLRKPWLPIENNVEEIVRKNMQFAKGPGGLYHKGKLVSRLAVTAVTVVTVAWK